jgi:GTP-binding protein EngB required for normal cell division
VWWLLVPVVGLVGKAVYDAISDSAPPPPAPRKKTTLELNLARLGSLVRGRSGYKVAIVGQPGAGKSSLLKKMTDGKVRPLPVVGVQTDATDWSLDAACDLVGSFENFSFVDVPGYDTVSHPLNVVMTGFPFGEFDCFVFVLRGKLRSADEMMFKAIIRSGVKCCIARSYSDSLEPEEVAVAEKDVRGRLELDKSVPVQFFSNRTGTGVAELFQAIRGRCGVP